MTYAELLQEVYNITARPDLVDLTETAVRSATLKAHQTDFYSKDIQEITHNFASAEYTQSLDIYGNLFSTYRALKFIRVIDSSGELREFLDVITSEELLDEWRRERTNVAYLAGTTLRLKASTEFPSVLVGVYVNPTVVDPGYSSWIANIHPFAIVHEAARQLFATIAMDAEKRSQESLVAEQYALLKINAISDVGS